MALKTMIKIGTIATFLMASSAISLVQSHEVEGEYAVSHVAVQINGQKDGKPYPGKHINLVESFSQDQVAAMGEGLDGFGLAAWESDRVGYRLYFNDQNIPDAFGKILPGPILDHMGTSEEYHALSPWGMDILHISGSLGLGGLGTYKDGAAHQVGKSTEISADTLKLDNKMAGARVIFTGLDNDGKSYDLTTDYVIRPGSRVTVVKASASGHAPVMAAGLIRNEGMTFIEDDKSTSWGYIATYGSQSENKDNLGLAVFYPREAVDLVSSDDHNLFFTFKDGANITYAFAAAWQQEGNGLKTEADFRKYLAITAKRLARNAPEKN